MWKLFKHLGEHKGAVALIILLLIAQAYCDLALPQYTSDIVDVGIQQNGIGNAVPDKMREETLQGLSMFMTSGEREQVQSAYTLQDGEYILNTDDKDTINRLDEILGVPMVIAGYMEENGQAAGNMVGDSATADKDRESEAAAPGYAAAAGSQTIKEEMAKLSAMSDDQIVEMREQMTEGLGDMSGTIIAQKAALFVKQEYEALGIDVNGVQLQYLLKTGFKMLGLTVLMMAAAILAGLLASRTAAGIGMDLRGKVFTKVVSFSNNELNKFSTASLITRSTNDIQQVQMVEVMLLRMVLYAPIIGIGGIIKVASTRTGLGWIIGVAVAAIMVVVLILMQVAMPKFKKMQALVDRLNLVSREILTGLSVIRAFSREKYEEERFEGANKELMSTQLFTNRVMTFMMPTMMLIMNAITVMIVWFGGKGIDAGHMQVGDMMAFITYTMQIVMAFLMITMISVMLPRAGVAADRIQEVLDTQPTIHDPNQNQDDKLEHVRGELTFEDVAFRYDGAQEDALEHISFTAKPGQTTAIIGSTGCGKSTLVHLIPRFYDVTDGRITIDGVDIRDISQKKLRSILGFVPQKGNLFSGDIDSNIRYAGDWITEDQMKEAALIAQASEFIDSKPEGYQSPISQGGGNVSGGQKQRLSIARAIAKNPQIFLFDDSFSALDYKTDMVLRRALHEKLEDATIVIVAQRISTILHANQIIVLEEGRIAGIGTHEELLKNCGAYQEIARSQLSEAELKGGSAS